MSTKIHLLSEDTVNQIAAGEVIENPASVVKELVENSIDAKATSIKVEIVGGGFQLIRVSDNGCGMSDADAKLSLLRHATSKISLAQDLFRLSTMGFRGEALASIAAISRVDLMTAEEDKTGIKLEVEAGKVLNSEPFARNPGTTIEVRSLFFNVPVRKKFQKSPSVCAAEIFKTIMILALGHPEVQFELISAGKCTLSVSSSNQRDFQKTLEMRATELLGGSYTHSIIPLNYEYGSLKLVAILGQPTETRPNRSGQYLFINRRAVFCPFIQEIIEEAYGSRLENHRFPVYLLHAFVPADLVDANVHPQKREIRLRDERFFRDRIHEAVMQAFEGKTLPPLPAAIQASKFSGTDGSFSLSESPFTLRFQESSNEDSPSLELQSHAINPLGIFAHYLILDGWSVNEEWDGLVLLDLQAARWRVAFEQLLDQSSVSCTQGLLVPVTVELSTVDNAMVLTHLTAIEAIGFTMRPIGRSTFIIEAVPSFLENHNLKEVIESLAQGLQEFIGKSHFEKEREKRLAFLTARFAKEKKQFYLQEAIALYHELQRCSDPFHCPKGRPVLIHLTLGQIEQFFGKS